MFRDPLATDTQRNMMRHIVMADTWVEISQLEELFPDAKLNDLQKLLDMGFLSRSPQHGWNVERVLSTEKGDEYVDELDTWTEGLKEAAEKDIATFVIPDLREHHLMRARVGFFEVEDEDGKYKTVEAYVGESRWNGWELPYVRKEEMPWVLEILYQDDEQKYTFDEDEGLISIFEGEANEEHVIEVDGITLYGIGHGLVWERESDCGDYIKYDYDAVFAAEPTECDICGSTKLFRSTYQAIGSPPHATRSCWGDAHRDADDPKIMRSHKIFDMEIPRKETK